MLKTYIYIPNEGVREHKHIYLQPSETYADAIQRTTEESQCWIWYNGYNGYAFAASSLCEARVLCNEIN